MAVRLAFIHALSSLHAGTGQGVGVIDLPIARERATNLPIVPGSSIKGCLRSVYTGPDADVVFGPEQAQSDPNKWAGALHISDARLLLLPVRCLGAAFVWTTCPYVLRRFRRDTEAAGLQGAPSTIPSLGDGKASTPDNASLIGLQANVQRLVLEDLDLEPAPELSAVAAEWAKWLGKYLFPSAADWQAEMVVHFAIIDDKSFDFLAEFATEVNAHVKIDDTGTVKHGGLWYQETLPAETVLVSVMQTDKSRKSGRDLLDTQIMDLVKAERIFQLGGKATTGQGMVRLIPCGGKS